MKKLFKFRKKVIGDDGIIQRQDLTGHIITVISIFLILFLIFIGVMAIIY